ncbi:hypothetical protein [Ketobacter sp.]|uniref:hypothetical protein n=1 Tax=Ketobacter sp. TaxID=2083498 RepID=UPI0025B90E19|nr:hypothetical protein [Ketobacter sp.]
MEIKSSRKMSNKRITGQGMSEYLVIVGLLAVAGIAAMGFMGGSVRQSLAAFAAEFAGDTTANVDAIKGNAQANANAAEDTSVAGLDNYQENNDNLGDTQTVAVSR